tara:strand:+ start:585 stop:803 length:219 start_codon:yes stop_codon:yes gene_type:complete
MNKIIIYSLLIFFLSSSKQNVSGENNSNSIASKFDGNKALNFDSEIINRLSKLNLGIDINQYVYGKELKPLL